MEANISSSVNECLRVQNDVADTAVAVVVKLTKSQKKNRRKKLKKKLKADLEPIDKPKDKESPLNDSLATAATCVDQKITVSSTAAIGDTKSLILGTESDKGNGATKLSKSQKQRMRKKLKKMENNGATTNRSVNGTKEKENKPNLSQSLNPQYLENSKAAAGLKKRKRKKDDDKDPDVSDVMKTCENTLANVVANTNLNGLVTENKKGNQESMNDRTNLGEFLNPQESQGLICENSETGSATNATDTTVSKKRKRKKMKKKDVVTGCILSTSEGPHDTVVTNKGSSGTVGLDTLGKKLLIIDVNGLLADIVYGPPKDIKADKYILRRAIFKRPFLDDFLRFCFERFNVGIWSSRTKKILDPVVDFLLGDFKKKLLFCWDASKCTNSGFRTLEDKHKCIVFKDLSKIWNQNGPGNSWVKGSFHESNRLLLDDSPYKALLNNKHTGIFPASYSYKDKDDDLLGPKGKLRSFLEGLAAADDVKTYVEQHPLGQGAIDQNSQNWAFYSRVLKSQCSGCGRHLCKRSQVRMN
ncbi:uncharacterized protein [Rutidosis leptorrhynchoides]|uniref:uncharacterized protein isoform X2 n=1 Tax=Rutidosis leptorrhynchoides TaxID=125765 RepID=UPI003A995D9D